MLNKELQLEIDKLKDENKILKRTVEEQKDFINKTCVENIELKKRNKELEENYNIVYESLKKKAKEYYESQIIKEDIIEEDIIEEDIIEEDNID